MKTGLFRSLLAFFVFAAVTLANAAGSDFALTATPATQTIKQNAYATYKATVSPLNGFNGVVTFAASGLPSLAKASFSPISVTASGSSTLTISCPGTTPPGNYTVTITATSGSTQHTATVTLGIQGFTLTASPTSQTVSQGKAASYVATVTALNGFSSTETMSVTGLPSGATASFTPASVSGSGTSTMSVLTSASTPAGSYTLAIKATSTSGSLYHTASATLSVLTGTAIAVSISPTSASVRVNTTQQFTATVTGTTNTGVQWSVDGVSGGNSTVGTISTSGLYTAPATGGTHTVTATSNADSTKTASATVTVTFTSVVVVSSIAPNWGTTGGGTTRTIYGQGFTTGATVTVGGAQATNVTVISDTAIEVSVPSGNLGTSDVVVTAADGQTSTLGAGYTYATANAPPAGLTNLRHIIFMLQENRSTDGYFGRMPEYLQLKGSFAAFDATPAGTTIPDVTGQRIAPFHLQTVCTEDAPHFWDGAHYSVDGGKMDNFLLSANKYGPASTTDTNQTRIIGYYDWTDIPYHYELAYQYATSDREFSPVLTSSVPNRMYMMAATSLGVTSNTPVPPPGGYTQFTIFDLLEQAGVSWHYYTNQNGFAPEIKFFATYAKYLSHFSDISNLAQDVQNESTLASVIFIENFAGKDEHPSSNIQNGAVFVKGLLDSITASPSWRSSAFILSYDEGGGQYDHVPPANAPSPDGMPPILVSGDLPGGFNQTGERVPLVVVSPWVKPHFISHTVRDHTSILKLIEVRFGLPPLTSRDDAADDMEEFFDFSTPHLLIPPPMPAQPTTGVCNSSLEKAPGQ